MLVTYVDGLGEEAPASAVDVAGVYPTLDAAQAAIGAESKGWRTSDDGRTWSTTTGGVWAPTDDDRETFWRITECEVGA